MQYDESNLSAHLLKKMDRDTIKCLCVLWIKCAHKKEVWKRLVEEPERFSSQITDKPGWHYFATIHSKYSNLIKELKEIEMPELMEKRFRYTGIGDLRMERLSRFHKKCDKCLQNSDDEQSKDSVFEGVKNVGKNRDKEDNREEMGSAAACAEQNKDDANEAEFSKSKCEGGIDNQKAKKKQRRKKRNSNDLDIADRFWFKRASSPPPKNEMEKFLDETRIQVRKELSTLLLLTKIVRNDYFEEFCTSEVSLPECAEAREKFCDWLENHFKPECDKQCSFTNKLLKKRLEENGELLEAKSRVKSQKKIDEKENWFDLATQIEKQLFSFIPGVPGRKLYKSLLEFHVLKRV